MPITREQFNAYKKIQDSGVTNMMMVRQVSRLSGGIISPNEVLTIIRNYVVLNVKFQ